MADSPERWGRRRLLDVMDPSSKVEGVHAAPGRPVRSDGFNLVQRCPEELQAPFLLQQPELTCFPVLTWLHGHRRGSQHKVRDQFGVETLRARASLEPQLAAR